MKCKQCNNFIVIHNNLINKKNKPLTMEDLELKGMIYTRDGLKEYSNSEICEVCSDELELDYKQLRSYRLRITK